MQQMLLRLLSENSGFAFHFIQLLPQLRTERAWFLSLEKGSRLPNSSAPSWSILQATIRLNVSKHSCSLTRSIFFTT